MLKVRLEQLKPLKPLLEEYQRLLRQPDGWFKVPLWTLAVLSSASSFVDNPVLGNTMFNQAGLHAWRVKTAAQLAKRRRAKLAKHLTAVDLSFFENNGFIIKENFLSL